MGNDVKEMKNLSRNLLTILLRNSVTAKITSFEPTLIGVGITGLVVAVLGTAAVWRKGEGKEENRGVIFLPVFTEKSC
jgi:hypothetical protein